MRTGFVFAIVLISICALMPDTAIATNVVVIEEFESASEIQAAEVLALQGDVIAMLRLSRTFGGQKNDVVEANHWLWLAARHKNCFAISETINHCESYQENGQCVRWYDLRDRHCPALTSYPCRDLANIRLLPLKSDWPIEDSHYAELQDHKAQARTCLIQHITDSTAMRDLRDEPTKVNDFAVGDLAFFLLADFGIVPFEDVLPSSVRKQLSDRGVFAYFDWIKQPGSRIALQAACREWVSKTSSK